MIILAIETSCDDTSVAILKGGNKILSNLVSSQIKVHSKYGGVVPEIASRMHAEKIHFLLDKALEEADLKLKDIDAFAVTYGPGLEGALLIGLSTAKTLAYLLKKPLIAVNHLHGHIFANFINNELLNSFICLIVSGGHTQLLLVKDLFEIEILGQTRDDAAGEAFDKIARYLGLGYPGGPIIEELSLAGSDKAFNFPRAMLKQGYEFSFSGLKTAVIQQIHKLKAQNQEINIPNICASFQRAVIDILVFKAIKACKEHNISNLVLSGGVIANSALREAFQKETDKNGLELCLPEIKFCTDNAAMIGVAGYFQYKKFGANSYDTTVNPQAKVFLIYK
jgi:N6-L-threonylcarbamoyladenine synthase